MVDFRAIGWTADRPVSGGPMAIAAVASDARFPEMDGEAENFCRPINGLSAA